MSVWYTSWGIFLPLFFFHVWAAVPSCRVYWMPGSSEDIGGKEGSGGCRKAGSGVGGRQGFTSEAGGRGRAEPTLCKPAPPCHAAPNASAALHSHHRPGAAPVSEDPNLACHPSRLAPPTPPTPPPLIVAPRPRSSFISTTALEPFLFPDGMDIPLFGAAGQAARQVGGHEGWSWWE